MIIIKNLYLLVSKWIRIMEGVCARSSMGVPCFIRAFLKLYSPLSFLCLILCQILSSLLMYFCIFFCFEVKCKVLFLKGFFTQRKSFAQNRQRWHILILRSSVHTSALFMSPSCHKEWKVNKCSKIFVILIYCCLFSVQKSRCKNNALSLSLSLELCSTSKASK